MAILGIEQIKELIEKPKASAILAEATAIQTKHKLHISGEGFEQTLRKIEGLESTVDLEIKKEHAKPTTNRIFSQILNQYKKVFRAQGFSRHHKFKDSDSRLVEDFVEYLQDVSHGLSMQKLMQGLWVKAVFEEMNGVFIVELPSVASEGDPEPFIDFIGLEHIHDIWIRGSKVEYIIFRSSVIINNKRVDKFRVIDDRADYAFIRENGKISLGTRMDMNEAGEFEEVDDIIPNIWGYVPVIQPSTIYNTLENDILKTSHVADVMPNADSYLSISNSHAVSVKKHQHPIFYSFPVTCPNCNGVGEVKHEDGGLVDCLACNTEGSVPFFRKDPSEGITLPEPDENNSANRAEAPCGYVSVDIESIKDQREELRFEENNIEKGALGVEGILLNKSKRETATGKEIDLQPLIDKLTMFSSNGEDVEGFLTKTIAKARYGDRYIKSDINWGKKFFVRTEQMIEQEFGEAKRNGLPVSALKELLEELYFTKFDNNPKGLTRSLLLLELEPFPTYTAKELVELDMANDIDLTIKIHFNDFIERFERNNGEIVNFMSQNDFNSRVEEVQEELKRMAEEKLNQEQQEDAEGSDMTQEERTSRLKAIIDINTAVATGAMDQTSAVETLKEMYGFDESVAKKLITTNLTD